MEDRYGSLIDDYLRGVLTAEQQREVESLLTHDENFRKELNFRKGTASAFARIRHQELKSRLAKLADKQKQDVVFLHPAVKARRRIGYAAAVLAFCIVGLGFLLFMKMTPSAGELYAGYFSAYPNVILPLERAADTPDARSKAYALYEAEQYQQAYDLFTTLDSDTDPEALFYAALSAMEADRIEDAVRLLGNYGRTPAPKLERQAKWYLALAHLKKGEIELSKELLTQLATSAGYNKDEAGALLKKLK